VTAAAARDARALARLPRTTNELDRTASDTSERRQIGRRRRRAGHRGEAARIEPVVADAPSLLPAPAELTERERRLLGDLFAIVEEHAEDSLVPIDRDARAAAFVFACEHHADQRRRSGEEFIVHPVGVARICAGMRLDTETLCAALLHDTVEDTTASLEEVHERFGEEIANLVDGVTKLTGITFSSRDEAQAENYRKMIVAMASDVRVILIKLADRLHNMRTIGALPKQKQIEKAKETLEIYAPIAHRLGIHALKWELEDLAFATLHPRKYEEIKVLVAQQRDDRERYVHSAGEILQRELDSLGIAARSPAAPSTSTRSTRR
jgi:guanosine-3',5'-bis(diphosphate) 3'-pyrophosphohydrolase